MSKPKAVLISDIHYNATNLPLAHEATTQALRHAEKLIVPMIIAGDLLDTKAVIRGECANALIDLLSEAKTPVYILAGNHDLLNEKGKAHALNFLSPYATIISSPVQLLDYWFVPYHRDAEELQSVLNKIPYGSTIIAHTGVQSAHMGHYVVDKSSLPKEEFADFRVISGHYHRRQDIKCGRPRKGAVGLFSYLGSPYSQSFGEASDGPKGFSVLYDDGSLELVHTNLRRHTIFNYNFSELNYKAPVDPKDLIWIKVKGTYQELESMNKNKIGQALLGHNNFKLEKLYTDAAKTEAAAEKHSGEELMDKLIDNTAESVEDKIELKELWRELNEDWTCK